MNVLLHLAGNAGTSPMSLVCTTGHLDVEGITAPQDCWPILLVERSLCTLRLLYIFTATSMLLIILILQTATRSPELLEVPQQSQWQNRPHLFLLHFTCRLWCGRLQRPPTGHPVPPVTITGGLWVPNPGPKPTAPS